MSQNRGEAGVGVPEKTGVTVLVCDRRSRRPVSSVGGAGSGKLRPKDVPLVSCRALSLPGPHVARQGLRYERSERCAAVLRPPTPSGLESDPTDSVADGWSFLA